MCSGQYRLTGLTGVVVTDCSSEPWGLRVNHEATWPMYVNPTVIYLLFYIVTVKQKHFHKVNILKGSLITLTNMAYSVNNIG